MHYVVVQPVHGLKVGTELTIELPVYDPGQGPDPATIAANLIGGALDIHAIPRAGGKGELDLVFEASACCGCFGGPADPGEVVAAVKVPGRTNAERKTRLATALIRGQLATALVPWYEAEEPEEDDSVEDDGDNGEDDAGGDDGKKGGDGQGDDGKGKDDDQSGQDADDDDDAPPLY